MKNIILYIFVLGSVSSFSQTLESIKKIDTIYIYFDYGNHQEKVCFKDLKIVSEYYYNTFYFKFKIDHNNFKFVYSDYKDFDSFNKGIKMDVKVVRKKFLKQKKDKILDIDFFLENGFRETVMAIYSKKFYIIDSKEIKGRKIVLREVYADFSYYEEM